MKRYRNYIWPYRAAFLLAPLCMLIEVFGEIMLPKLMSMIVNHGVAQRNVPYIVSVGAGMAAMSLVMALGGVGGAYFSSKASICFTSDLREALFARIQSFSFQNLDQYSTGSLVTRLTNDIQQVQNVTMLGLRMMVRAPGMLIGALIMAFLMNRRLAMVILWVIPFLILAIAIILKIAFPRFTQMQKKLDQMNGGIQEALTNVRVIKSFVRQEFEEEKFRCINEELKEKSLSAINVALVAIPVMTMAMNITTLAVVWYGGNLIIAGQMPVGDLTAFTTYIVQILMSLMMLAMVFLQSSRAMASVRRIGEVMDTQISLTDDAASRKELLVSRGKVEFQDVSFSYHADAKEKALEHISFTAYPGQTIGIVGATGSGKSTMVQLIPRLYDVSFGRVLVDDVDVREYSLRGLREGIGMVLQNNVLFSGTIEDNLRWGREEATPEEMKEAARSAQADGFITSFPEGYQNPLEQGGVNVSGGQKQRLCLARALLKRPRILILDDSTSAVDTATEAKIQECFAAGLKDTTKFIISQRISSVEKADQILVLDEGRIIGMGSHKELMERCQAYQEIYDSQRDRGEEVSGSCKVPSGQKA